MKYEHAERFFLHEGKNLKYNSQSPTTEIQWDNENKNG